jgi:hypothetical protein
LKKWLCFGVILKPVNPDSNAQLAEELKTAGYLTKVKESVVLISPNDKLFSLFKEIELPMITDYKPAAIPDEKWTTGSLVPSFPSLKSFLLSDWCSQYFLNPETGPLGEGVVLASTFNGKLYKIKHGGEDCGIVPDKIWDALEYLKDRPDLEPEFSVCSALEKILKARYKVVEAPPKKAA